MALCARHMLSFRLAPFNALLPLALVVGALAEPPSAQARTCLAHEALTRHLAERYGEVLAGMGEAGGNLIELYRSDKTASWTILVTQPNGTSCMVAAGRGWQDVAPKPPAGDDA